MLIFHLVVNFVSPKTLRSALWRWPILIRLLEIVTKVMNLETVKMKLRHLRFFFFFSARLVPVRKQCPA